MNRRMMNNPGSRKQSIINIRSETYLQIAKNLRKFEFRGHGLRIHLNQTTVNWTFTNTKIEYYEI